MYRGRWRRSCVNIPLLAGASSVDQTYTIHADLSHTYDLPLAHKEDKIWDKADDILVSVNSKNIGALLISF